MSKSELTFKAKLQHPVDYEKRKPWAFVVLPKKISDQLPRRGRTTVEGTINDIPFRQTLEPDGNLSHWIPVDHKLLTALDEDTTQVEVMLKSIKEPEPKLPADFSKALKADKVATETWNATTTLARVDWIHWIVSGKQAATCVKRINDAINMLGGGKKRVCCFDPSGHYAKSLSAPKAAG